MLTSLFSHGIVMLLNGWILDHDSWLPNDMLRIGYVMLRNGIGISRHGYVLYAICYIHLVLRNCNVILRNFT